MDLSPKNWFRTEHTIVAANLPKSFGCEIQFGPQQVYRSRQKVD